MNSPHENQKSYFLLHVKGLVQGVGFRPFIYRLATEQKLYGWVINRNDGVLIKIQGSIQKTEGFKEAILANLPTAAIIHDISIQKTDPEHFVSFRIKTSEAVSDEVTLVSPDIAVCDNCLEDLKTQSHRIDYPFINCTNCGPRFSIIRELPYDRPNTSMDIFEMCTECEREYKNIEDRRFHAQPVACNNCGPRYTFRSENTILIDQQEIIRHLAIEIDQGKIFAIKGLGGYHLVCDALNDVAVERIREIKNREGKPFAVMVKSIEQIDQFARVKALEVDLLENWKRPIVLLKRKNKLADKACSGLDNIGIMLPYMPFHHLLFEKLKATALVMTSGNLSSEPIIISNNEADETFSELVDGLVEYNRDIYNRVDDSVARVFENRSMILRRSRGFTPTPILTNHNCEGILALGAELVNSFCIGKGNMAIMSPYIGDLKDFANIVYFEKTYKQYCKLFNFKPDLIVADFHPAYLSSQFGEYLSKKESVPLIKAQHHHAHNTSVMMENKIEGRDVIGICLDGMGAGKNNENLGAEFFTANLIDINRVFHFRFIPLPGGDMASKEPWRAALSYLHDAFGEDLESLNLPLYQHIPSDNIKTVVHMLKHKLNSPLSSSAGRLFDAVAAITGVCYFNTFQAEAPMRLESIISSGEKGYYSFEIKNSEINFQTMIKQLVADLTNKVSIGIISARFHNTLVELCFTVADQIRSSNKIITVILSGGTFQNSYLTVNVEKRLRKAGFNVYLPETVPVNDQGISLGQMGIAAEMRKLGLI